MGSSLRAMGRLLIKMAAGAAAIAVLAAVTASAQEPRLRKLKFSGVERLRMGEIKRVMKTPFPSFFARLPLVRYPEFDQDTFEGDLRSVEDLYKSRGFFNVDITHEIERNERRNTVKVRVDVREGEPANVGEIVINFQEEAVPEGLCGTLLSQLTFEEGGRFLVEEYQKSKTAIENYLTNNGYPDTRVTGRVVVYQATNLAQVTYEVDRGELRYFGDIDVTGNELIARDDIIREVTFRPGDLFSLNELYRSQRNILGLGLFDSVVLNQEERGEEDRVPIEVAVDETELRTVRLGLGYGYEDRLRVQAGWTRRYVLGRPSMLSFGARYSSLVWSGDLTYTQPYFIDRRTNLSLRAGYDREFAISYSNEKISAQSKLGRWLGSTISGYLAYNLEVNRPLSVDPWIVDVLREIQPGEYYFLSGVLLGFEQSTVNDPLYPRDGLAWSLYLEPATFILGSAVDYFKGFAEGRWYQEVVPGTVAAVRANFGFIEPMRFTRDIPIFKRFFLGGSNSVRGYPYQSIGPVNAAGEPIGGHYQVQGNFEARFPVVWRIRGVLFTDMGNVYRTSFDFSFDNLRYAAGAGLRYDTLIGPIRLDVAFPFTLQQGVNVSTYSIYISLGPTF